MTDLETWVDMHTLSQTLISDLVTTYMGLLTDL